MKILSFLVLVALASVALTGHGQTYQVFDCAPPPTSNTVINPGIQFPSSGTNYAEVITPDIQALANGLQDDPVKIFKYVHDHIKFVLYYGSMKGAELTLLEQSGNDFDQCALLVALLNAAGYSPTYQYSLVKMPYQATDGTQNDLMHWWSVTMPNTNSSATYSFLDNLTGSRGFSVFDPIDSNDYGVQHVWVSLTFNGTNYLLDPSFKVTVSVSGINLASAMGFNSNSLVSAVGGSDNGYSCSGLSEANLRNTLTGYTTNLLNYLQSNYPNASVQQILGGSQIMPYTNNDLGEAIVFTTLDNPFSNYPELFWTNEPTSFMSTLTIQLGNTNQGFFFPQLEGQGLFLDYSSNSIGTLYLGNSIVLQTTNTFNSGFTNVTLSVTHPWNSWNTGNNTPTDTGQFDQSTNKFYQGTDANYAILYAFEPSVKWLNELEQQLDIYEAEGYSNTSPQVVNATLEVMGMDWLVQSSLTEGILCQQENQLLAYGHRIGRMAQESGNGYYVDVYLQEDATFPATGHAAGDFFNDKQAFEADNYFASALESGMIQQLQNSNLLAASTVKLLQIANSNETIYLASSSSWSLITNSLSGYGSLPSTTFWPLIQQNYYFLLPQNGSIAIGPTGSYKGLGYVELKPSGNTAVIGMLIGGGYNGGFVEYPSSQINVDYTQSSLVNQPSYFFTTPVSTPAPSTGDPLDTEDGTFQIENTDLSLGQAEPKGIALSRYYNGTRRFSNPAGMADGWIHNYSVTANNIAAPEAALGQTTPAQMAPMLVATCASLNFYNSSVADAKNWMVMALIAKWGVDQLITNGVSVNLGKDTLQFIQQPNGAFTPPANSTATLLWTNSAYVLQMRHGNAFKFNSAGYLTNIVDQYGNALTLTYTTSNWVNTVKDWKGRTLTFNYSNTPSRLAAVSDGTRTVYYNYSTFYNSQGDLTSFTDAEGKTSTYAYDINHEMTATLDALNRLVVSNQYDGDGHVNVQYSEGMTNKMSQIFWSGWQTISEDPAGDQQTYFYDNMGRLVGMEDALSNLTQTFYDGQNHIIETVSPLNETNLSFYDGNNNLTVTVDPLGFTNQYVYDSNNNLVKAIDPHGNPTTYGYNSEFSLIGQTNGAGDFVNYVYNTTGSSLGTLASRTDSGGTTTYSYDSTYGQLTNITYPNGLGGEGFANSFFGDVTNQIDGRGFATVFQYNNRRELTNTIAPTNLTASVSYDAADNVAGKTDARHNTASQTWNPTRHLMSTTMPAMPQGTPLVTNIYDNRDWFVGMVDPLQNQTTYANDPDQRQISQTDPLLRTATFSYDADSRKLAMVNPSKETNSQTWDAKGELVGLIDGAGHTSTRLYDGAGNQVVLTNRNTNPWHFYYDAANRLTNTVSPRGRSATMAFNHQGLPSFITDPATQVTTNLYDAKGRLTNRADKVASTFYGYDADNNRTSIVENGKTNLWTYDAYDRVSSYTDVNGYLIQYYYDADGNLTNLVYPGGRNVYYAYDSNNHMTNVMDWSGRKTSITYDLDGRLTSITRPNGTHRTIGYDSVGEITNVLEQMANSLPIALMRFNWNSNSTMQWEFLAPQPHTNTLPTRMMAYDTDNELFSVDGADVSIDNDGNLISGPLTNDTFATYTFDARNRLIAVGGITNLYDAANNRIEQIYGTNSIIYVVNPTTSFPQVLLRIKNGITNYYVYGPDLLYQITEAPTGTNTFTYHYDYRGSTIALTADNGLASDRMEYSTYGTMTYHAGIIDTPFLFNGRFGVMSDPNGLLYMRARYYSPFLCRFLNPDPKGFSAGLNFYAYVDGNPVSKEDPLGLQIPSPANGAIGWSDAFASDPAKFDQMFQAANQQALPMEASALGGVAVGAAGAAAVTVAAPTATLALTGAGLSPAAASATVTTTLYGVGAVGGLSTIYNTVNDANAGNLNGVAFDLGTLGGGSFIGGIGGGRFIADYASPEPSTVPVSMNPFTADYVSTPTAPNGYGFQRNSNLPLGQDLWNFAGTGPTPSSGGGAAAAISSGATSFYSGLKSSSIGK